MIGFILFTLVFQLSEGKPATTCPDGWLAFRGSCYLFGAGNMAFTPAEQYCQQHKGGHLVHVNDAVENAFLKEHMRDTTNFHAGDGGDHHLEDCGFFYSDAGFQWADVSCTYTTNIRPLCEMSSLACEEGVVVG